MYKVLVEKTIPVPRKAIFDALAGFGGVEKVVPDLIKSCELHGSGIGAQRNLTLQDGGTLTERCDGAYGDSVFIYSIVANTALPVENYVSVVTLADDGNGNGTKISWGSNWDAKGASEDEVKGALTGLYNALIDGVQKVLS